jgi:hypothetical protein
MRRSGFILPNFIVIGAQKSGTSSLHHYLQAHPEICMSRAKEPDFFTLAHNWSRGIAWYERQFPRVNGEIAIGEVSPSYTMHPSHPDVPARMASIIPKAKLVYLVRDPIARMKSHYQHRVAAGVERLPIEQALREDAHYLNTSRYAYQISRYLEYFPASHLLVVPSEALLTRRKSTLRRIFRFLGVDQDWWSPDLERKWYVTSEHRQRRVLTAALIDLPGVKAARRSLPAGLKRSLKTVTHRDPILGEPSLSPEFEERLRQTLREDVVKLRGFLPDDFEGWNVA